MHHAMAYGTLAQLLLGTTALVVLAWATLHRFEGFAPVWRAAAVRITNTSTMAAISDARRGMCSKLKTSLLSSFPRVLLSGLLVMSCSVDHDCFG
jgi:hypothetical protein